jgi:flagellar hook-associated protein FlgK
MSKIISDNHIKGNEKDVTAKIKLFISNRFHKDSLILKEFKYKEQNIGEIPTNEWKEYLTENILANVLKEKGEKSLSGTLQNFYDSFKYNLLDKILI